MESSSKRRKINHGNLELRHSGLIDFESRESAQLSTASTFLLQTDELLKEVKVDYANALNDVDGLLHRLKGLIESIQPHDSLPISEATAKFEKEYRIVIPYPDPKPVKDAPYKVSYAKPSQCNVVGSYISRTMVRSQPTVAVDMVVQMPKSLFQDKDYMNMRYFYRRAYYIAYIAAHLHKNLGESMDFKFELFNENPLLPILMIKPRSSAHTSDEETKNKNARKHSYAIKIIPCVEDNLFPWSKTMSTSTNIRVGEAVETKDAQVATPFYNSTLNAERSFISYLRLLAHTRKACSAFGDACILGRIWLQQRGFDGAVSNGGFGHFEWAAIMALLLQMGGRNGQPLLSNSLSSTELFKAILNFISTTDFIKKAFAFGSSNVAANTIREVGPVIFDPTRRLNLLLKMTPWSAGLLQLYAKQTINLLADETADKFEPTFIMKTDIPFQVFDVIFKINSTGISKFAETADRRGAVWNFCSETYKQLKQAYGNRAQLVHLQLPRREPWPLGKPQPDEVMHTTVGVIFDPAQMSRQMEYGPPAEEQREAAQFRQLWGEKAELRRFKDGSILECVGWSSKAPIEICEEITCYILQRHLKIAKDDVSTIGREFSSIISLSHLDKPAFDAARQAFQNFERDIRNLEEMPLHVRQLTPISPLARYSSIEPPFVGFHNGSIELMEVNLYFEASSKWPENLTAIQEAKVEFLLDIDKRLKKAHENLMTYLGRENKPLGTENLAYLDVIYEKGEAFRLRIHCDLEETLLEQLVKNKTLEGRIRQEAEESFERFNWLYNTLPLHTQTIATFCTRFTPLSQTIRLVKHWFNSHKMAGHFEEELIEVLVLYSFLQPYPWRQPSSVITGFLRTLFFLSRWDWRSDPLIVDTAENLTEEDRAAIRQQLRTLRKRDPKMNDSALYVATSYDQSGLVYTRERPSTLAASRMTRLAKAACKLVRENGVELAPSLLFETALQDYDVLLHLSPKAVRSVIRDSATESGTRKQSQYKNLNAITGSVPLPIRKHPTDVLVEEFQRVYEDSLLFFRGREDDTVLAAVWNPRLQRQKFRAGLQYNFHGHDADADHVEINRNAVLLEIARAGSEMIREIEVEYDEED